MSKDSKEKEQLDSNENFQQNEQMTDFPQKQGRWDQKEHDKFLEGVKMHGKNWKQIELFMTSRSGQQIRSHAQKYYNKISKQLLKNPQNIDLLEKKQLLDILQLCQQDSKLHSKTKRQILGEKNIQAENNLQNKIAPQFLEQKEHKFKPFINLSVVDQMKLLSYQHLYSSILQTSNINQELYNSYFNKIMNFQCCPSLPSLSDLTLMEKSPNLQDQVSEKENIQPKQIKQSSFQSTNNKNFQKIQQLRNLNNLKLNEQQKTNLKKIKTI